MKDRRRRIIEKEIKRNTTKNKNENCRLVTIKINHKIEESLKYSAALYSVARDSNCL